MIGLVAGLARCGSSLTMAILQAGGLRVVGLPPVYEVAQFQPQLTDESFLRRCDGRILKWLDPAKTYLPKSLEVGPVLWLDRDPVQQAASFTKLCTLWGEEGRSSEDELAERLSKSTASTVARLSECSSFTRLSFESILADPIGAASLLAQHFRPLGVLDCRAAAQVVKPRTPACQPDMEFDPAAVLMSFRSFRLEA